MSKVAKVLLGLIYLLLAGFLAAGCYFLFYGVTGAGLVGIGVFLAGGGCTGFIRLGLFEEGTGSEVRSAVDLDSEMKVSAAITRIGDLNRTTDNGVVYVCKDGLYIEQLYPTLLHILYEKVSNVVVDGQRIQITSEFVLAGQAKQGVVEIVPKQALKTKALVQVLRANTHVM